MTLFQDEPVRPARSGADWEVHRQHRYLQSGPPQDEIGELAMACFELARAGEVVVAVRGVTAYSDGLHLAVVVLFADEQRAEDLTATLRDFGRSPGRFRLGCRFSDGRTATAGSRESPEVELPEPSDTDPQLLLLDSAVSALMWTAGYWLWPLPPAGPLVLGCRWHDRGIVETLVQLDTAPLLEAAAVSRPVWLT